MFEFISLVLSNFEELLWFIAFPSVVFVGIYFTIKTRAIQLRKFPYICKNFFSMMLNHDKTSEGVHPFKTFFACIGGAVGIGNIVGITTALQLGGPGAVFWVWVTAIAGALVKYGEVFLGMKNRVLTPKGFRGGPMYVLEKAFSGKGLASLFCVLLCLYGVDVFQFSVMSTSVSQNFGISRLYVSLFFLFFVVLAEAGGVKRIGAICGTIIPIFIVVYLSMGSWLLLCNATKIPAIIFGIFHSAFTPHAALGAFAGSTLLMTISQGIRRSCYSCDIGVGYASIIHSESSTLKPSKQASLILFEVFLDTFIVCTMSLMIVLTMGTWKEDLPAIYLVQKALSSYFPYMNLFIPSLFFLLGYSTFTTYFCSGMKTASFLSPTWGRPLYYLYAASILFLFSFIDTSRANSVMSCILALLLLLNISALWRLRHEVLFDFLPADEERATKAPVAMVE
jgi:alanine or glycine:cation symporter, AGCS family